MKIPAPAATTAAITLIILIALFAMLALATLPGCIRDKYPLPQLSDPPISFSTTIDERDEVTRAGESGWHDGDTIGIWMVPAGEEIADHIENGNAPYRHRGRGEFTALAGHELFYPRVGLVDFVACHPWRPTRDDHRYQIDGTDQSDPHAIDFLWSDNATGHISGDTPFLEFRHVLSKLVFRLHDISGGSLDDLGSVVEGVVARGVFDLSAGRLVSGESAVVNVVPFRAEDGDDDSSTARLEAIVLPGGGLSPTVGFTFADGGRGLLTLDRESFLGGKMYVFDVTVTEGGEVTMGGSRIVDWDDSDYEPGEYTVHKTDPEDGGDDPDDPENPDDPDDPDSPVGPSERKRYFVETMGDVGDEGPVGIDNYKGWSNTALTITDSFNGARISRHGELGTHIYFAPGVDSDLRIGGLPEGYTDVTLSYDIAVDGAGGVSAATIRVWAGTQNLTSRVTKIIPSPGQYVRVTIDNLPDEVTSLRFVSDAGVNTRGMRLDNISLEGIFRSQ